MSLWSYQALSEISDEEYARWQTLLEARTGICFLQHKSILQKGLSLRMREVGAENYDDYFQHVSKVPEGAVEWAQLVDRISVKETSFFREPHSYDAVRQYLYQRLAEQNHPAENTLDIWSVGCSTGEEAYSLAMHASEVIDYFAADVFWGVMATDISRSALSVAKQGRYSARKLSGLSLALMQKYFAKCANNEYEVALSLKERVCFSQGNIVELSKRPKIAMDIIYCQNVLVYFRKEKQYRVLDSLVSNLKPGGLLIIGPGEVIGWQHHEVRRSKNELVQAYIKELNS